MSATATAEPETIEWWQRGHRARRNERLALREAGRAVLLDQRAKGCGLLPTRSGDGGWTVLRAEVDGEQVAQVHGPGLCGKVNLCGWCAGPIRQKRATEIDEVLAEFLAAGGTVWLVTATTSPVDGETIDDAKHRVLDTYKAWTSGGARARWNDRYGQVCSHRTLEVTITPEPMRAHWHAHTLLFLGAVPAEREGLALVELRRLWIEAAEERGATVHWRHGFDVVPVMLHEDGTTGGVGSYVAKSAGMEATRGDMKKSRGDSFAPLELVRAFAETGDLIYRHAHQAYEQAVAGVGPLRWSQHWRRNLRAWIEEGFMNPIIDEGQGDEHVPGPADEDEVPAELIEGARPVASIDAHAARWFASRRMFAAVHLAAEGAPSDDQVPDYLRALAVGSGAPRHVLAGIGPPGT